MAHPGIHAKTRPDHPAIIMAGSGQALSYDELDRASNRLAHLLRDQGLERGDHMALFMENQILFMEIVWAAFRSGVYVTAVNSFLTAEEVAYIVDDCDARVVITSRAKADVAGDIDPATTPKVERWLMVDAIASGGAIEWESYEAATAGFPHTPIDDEHWGTAML